jgi:hypothetical protein
MRLLCRRDMCFTYAKHLIALDAFFARGNHALSQIVVAVWMDFSKIIIFWLRISSLVATF